MITRTRREVKPTEVYPKILWYQVKNPEPTAEMLEIVYNRHYERLVEILTKKYPGAVKEDIEEASREQAKNAADKEVNRPTKLERVVVEDMRAHNKMVALIENSDNFIQWYEK